MSKVELLKIERNRLVEEWQTKGGDDRVKLLVKIMDLEEDIQQYSKLLLKKEF